MIVRPEILLIAGAAVVGGLLLAGRNAGAVGESLGGAAVDMVDGVVSGGVFAIGDRLGLADTREQTTIEQGRAQLAAGNYWDASFNLPAGEFISGSLSRIFN